MKLRWLALAVILILTRGRGAGSRPDVPGPDERTHVPSVEAIRALASVPELAPRSSASAVEPSAAKPAAVDTVHALVLDASGKPRVGVPVFLLRALDAAERDVMRVDPEKGEFLGERTTDADGLVAFPIASRELAYLCSIVEKESVHVAEWVGDAQRIVLRYPAPYEGDLDIEVVTDSDAPVPEYALSAHVQRDRSLQSLLDTNVRSANGRFRIPIGNRVSARESLMVGVIGPVEYEHAIVRYTRAELDERRVRRIVLVEKKAGLRGFVVTSAGAAVERAGVSWAESRDVPSTSWTTTDAHGVFVLDPKARRDRGVLFVEAEGHAPVLGAIADVPVTAAGELRVELATGATLEGLVTLDGEPSPGAHVVAWIAGPQPQGLGVGGFWSSSATADAAGRYRIERLPLAMLHVAAQPKAVLDGTKRHYAGVRRVEILSERQHHDVRLESGLVARGSLRLDDSDDGMLFLEVYDSRDPTAPWSTATCESGKNFELAIPRASDATLRVWLNPSDELERSIAATSVPVDLGRLELSIEDFRKPRGK